MNHLLLFVGYSFTNQQYRIVVSEIAGIIMHNLILGCIITAIVIVSDSPNLLVVFGCG